MKDTTATTEGWVGDKCERKPIGDFLYKLVMHRYGRHHTAQDANALCIALDAEWGAGKTFFVSHWSNDIERGGHLTIRFDAWKNDLSDDPLIAFLSQLQSDIKPWVKKQPMGKTVREATARRFTKVMAQGKKAAGSLAGAFAKGAANRYAPGFLDELASASGLVDADPPADKEAKSFSEAANTALSKFLDDAVKVHTDRQAAIDGLKASIASLLSYLEKQQLTRLPMFVFIDELDRCRPDYAVRLLEGVKHLFDAPGVCFIFSTNMKQLAFSMQAIYGPSFDSRRYLKRFFNFEYLLPAATPNELARELATASDIVERGLPIFAALPQGGTPASTPIDVLAMSFVISPQAQPLE